MLRKALLVLPLFFTASMVQADTIFFSGSVASQNTDLGNLIAPSLQMFNPALGTLTKVTLTLRGYGESNLSVENPGTTNQNFQYNSSIDFTLTGDANYPGTNSNPPGVNALLTPPLALPNLPLFDVTMTTIAANSTTNYGKVLFDRTDSFAFSDPTDLLQFVGLGSLDFVVATGTPSDSSGSGGNLVIRRTTFAGADMEITYEYTPAVVPEPSSLAIAGLAGGLLVVASRLRKRRAA